MKLRLAMIGAVVVALLATGIGGTLVLAQGPTTTPTAPSAGTTPSPSAPSSPSTTGAPSTTGTTLSDLYLQALAQRLGTTVDKLQQAAAAAQTDAINQAVKQGLITQAQAAPLLQRTVNSAVQSAGLDAAAKTLGMTTADLRTALRSKTLLTIMQDKNVDATTLRTAIANAEKAAIDQAVKDGKLTQAQADTMKARITPDNIDLNRRGFGGQVGLGGFFNGMLGGPFGGMNGMQRGGRMMGPQSGGMNGMQPGGQNRMMPGGQNRTMPGGQNGMQPGGQSGMMPGGQNGMMPGGQSGTR